MNKTTEALKLAENTLEDIIRVYKFETGTPVTTLAAIREALAEPEITTPDVCGEVCARAKLCYGCGKALDEANAELAEPFACETGECPDKSLCAGACECLYKAEPVKQEPVTTDLMDMLRLIETIKYLQGIAERGLGREIGENETIEQFVLGYVKQLESTQPVKQELVNQKAVGCYYGAADRIGHVVRIDVEIPIGTLLYAAPVSAEAIRAEALEEAAKWFEGNEDDVGYAIATEIRGLK